MRSQTSVWERARGEQRGKLLVTSNSWPEFRMDFFFRVIRVFRGHFLLSNSASLQLMLEARFPRLAYFLKSPARMITSFLGSMYLRKAAFTSSGDTSRMRFSCSLSCAKVRPR